MIKTINCLDRKIINKVDIRVRKYLKEINKNPRRSRDFQEEIKRNLIEAIEELLKEGHSQEEAVEIAFKRFGELANEFKVDNFNHQDQLKWLHNTSMATAVTGLVLFIPELFRSVLVRLQIIFGIPNTSHSQFVNIIDRTSNFIGFSPIFLLAMSLILFIIITGINISQNRQDQMRSIFIVFVLSMALYLTSKSVGESMNIIIYLSKILISSSFMGCIAIILLKTYKKWRH